MTDKTRNRANCECKYCTGRPQREITQGLPAASQPHSGTPSSSTASRQLREKRKLNLVREAATRTVVRRAPKVVKLPKGPRQHSMPDREKDLMAIRLTERTAHSTSKKPRWARKSELVWVKLQDPIPLDDASPPEEGLIFWPGIIESYDLRVTTMLSDVMDVDAEASNDKNSDDDCPWKLAHTTIYQIRLLIVDQTVRIDEGKVIPYQAYAPSNHLINAISKVKVPIAKYEGLVVPSEAESEALERFSRFRPFISSSSESDEDKATRSLSNFAAPFALAIQVASRITSYWTPTDPWECKLAAPLGA